VEECGDTRPDPSYCQPLLLGDRPPQNVVYACTWDPAHDQPTSSVEEHFTDNYPSIQSTLHDLVRYFLILQDLC